MPENYEPILTTGWEVNFDKVPVVITKDISKLLENTPPHCRFCSHGGCLIGLHCDYYEERLNWLRENGKF